MMNSTVLNQILLDSIRWRVNNREFVHFDFAQQTLLHSSPKIIFGADLLSLAFISEQNST